MAKQNIPKVLWFRFWEEKIFNHQYQNFIKSGFFIILQITLNSKITISFYSWKLSLKNVFTMYAEFHTQIWQALFLF